MRQAQLGKGLVHQPFAGRLGMRGRDPVTQLIQRDVRMGGHFGGDRRVHVT